MMMTFRLLGPAVGFLLSSFCLRYYEDPFYDPGFSNKDPRWVGAWWLGFMILGFVTFACSLLLVLFPKRFHGKKLHPTSSKQQEGDERKTPLQQLKGMCVALKRLVKNPILMCYSLGVVFRLNGTIGYYVLLPKYMETQFRQSSSKASLLSGPVSVIGMQVGILLSGIIIRRWQPRPRLLTGVIVFTEGLSVMALLFCMSITCPTIEMVGITQQGNHQAVSLQNECNTDCMCTTKAYTPVCGPDGKSSYFSPCFAGCRGNNKTGGTEIFTNCKCIFGEDGGFTMGGAEKGYCDPDCQWMLTFVVVLAIVKLLSSFSRLPNLFVVLRCVDPQDKTLAFGALNGVASLFAFIPYPLIYGALADASCLVWHKSCGKTGNCWVYDNDKFRFLLHGVTAMFGILGTITDIIVCILSPRLKNLYDEEEETPASANDKNSNPGNLENVTEICSSDDKQQISNGQSK